MADRNQRVQILTIRRTESKTILLFLYLYRFGAFGCGAFQNDPEVVARAYKTALEEFPKAVKQIECAR